MKIAVLTRIFSVDGGGAERYSVSLVNAFLQRNPHSSVHVFAQEFVPATPAHPNLHHHIISSPFKKSRWINQLWYAHQTYKATQKLHPYERFDVVHSHENVGHGTVQTVHVLPVKFNLMKKWLEKKQGHQTHPHQPQKEHPHRTWFFVATSILGWRWQRGFSPRLFAYLALEKHRLTPFDQRVVASSPALVQSIEIAYPTCINTITTIIPAASIPDHTSSDPNVGSTAQIRMNWRQQLGIPENVFLLAFVANDFAKKGLLVILQALRRLPPLVHVVVVGSNRNRSHQTKQMAWLQQGVKLLKLENRVHTLGALADVSPVYQMSDALLHPTQEDTFAMVVLEAMLHGLPVVVSGLPYCGIAGLLENGKHALLLNNPKNTPELVLKLTQLMQNGTLQMTLREHGQAFAKAQTWDAVAQRYEAVYESVQAMR